MKRKWLVLLIVFVLLLTTVSTVFAGGDKNQGEIGIGATHEECGTQPGCNENPPMPGPSTDSTILP